jgi:hypothetical protein
MLTFNNDFKCCLLSSEHSCEHIWMVPEVPTSTSAEEEFDLMLLNSLHLMVVH